MNIWIWRTGLNIQYIFVFFFYVNKTICFEGYNPGSTLHSEFTLKNTEFINCSGSGDGGGLFYFILFYLLILIY
jgi:hypothetical protein